MDDEIKCLGCDRRCSELTIYSMWEARKYRWIRSEQEHRDLGHDIVEYWYQHCFYHWYRDRLIEHFSGKRFWSEFSKDNFNILERNSYNRQLVVYVLDRLLVHHNNISEQLGIIHSSNVEDLDEIMRILHMLDINMKRREFSDECIDYLEGVFSEADKYKWIKSNEEHRDMGEAIILDWFRMYYKTG